MVHILGFGGAALAWHLLGLLLKSRIPLPGAGLPFLSFLQGLVSGP